MTHDDLRAVFDAERPHHPEWSVTSFGLMLSPTLMALLELYVKHPQARRSAPPAPTSPPRMRPPDWRPRPVTPFKVRGLDQKQLASGEKPDDD
jgi:hypothetical protein